MQNTRYNWNACLPGRLKLLPQKFGNMSPLDRVRFRVGRTKFWMERLSSVRLDEQALKQNTHPMLEKCWLVGISYTLVSRSYEDMGVVEEFSSGSSLLSAPLILLVCGLPSLPLQHVC